jgi:hypothetical protein
MDGTGNYLGRLFEYWRVSGILGLLLIFILATWPVGVVTLYHPADAVGFHAWLVDLAIPEYVTLRQLIVSEVQVLMALAFLFLLQLGIVTLIYKRTGFYIALWPVGLFLIGGLANGIWYLTKGYFDPVGAMAGLTPVVTTVVIHGICERLAGKLAFGDGPKPKYQPGY